MFALPFVRHRIRFAVWHSSRSLFFAALIQAAIHGAAVCSFRILCFTVPSICVIRPHAATALSRAANMRASRSLLLACFEEISVQGRPLELQVTFARTISCPERKQPLLVWHRDCIFFSWFVSFYRRHFIYGFRVPSNALSLVENCITRRLFGVSLASSAVPFTYVPYARQAKVLRS